MGCDTMGKRIPLSTDEKEYIWRWAYKKSWRHIADELGEIYAAHNGGSRCWATVKSYIKRKNRPKEKIGYYPVQIRADVLQRARAKGFSQNDLSDLLEEHISQL
ncbi:MAG: hypothetical protein BWY93_01477 [Euryarchaeota archaeon ADurb.BinA087]|nr:MAG: hypothetical protein BWY93_01477 [Euryarchaeota archaeon ADurb.BinA087]